MPTNVHLARASRALTVATVLVTAAGVARANELVYVDAEPECASVLQTEALRDAIAQRLPGWRVGPAPGLAPDPNAEQTDNGIHADDGGTPVDDIPRVHWMGSAPACMVVFRQGDDRVVLAPPQTTEQIHDVAARIAWLVEFSLVPDPPAPAVAPHPELPSTELGGSGPAAPLDPAASSPRSPAEPATLFRGGRITGAFGGLTVVGTSMLGKPAILMGARGALVRNGRAWFGIEGVGIANRVRTGETNENDEVTYAFGGVGNLMFGGEFNATRLVHPYVVGTTGVGAIVYQSLAQSLGNPNTTELQDPNRGVVIMAAALEVGATFNLATFARIDVGVQYRRWFPMEIEAWSVPGLRSRDLGQFGGTLTARFGRFTL